MSQLFKKIIREALKTFDKANSSNFKANLAALRQLTDSLTIQDINLDYEKLKKDLLNENDKSISPCTYVHIYENDFVSISIFILSKNYQMPLHDHPLMYGILKPLSGQLLIQSYSKEYSGGVDTIYDPNYLKNIPVKADDPVLLGKSSNSLVLTPKQSNFHEITAIDDVGAFFDILSPPYDSDIIGYGSRDCNFYRKRLAGSSHKLVLDVIPPPPTYKCNKGFYQRPPFLLDLEKENSSLFQNLSNY